MGKAQQAKAAKIYDALTKQRFADFYNGEFNDHFEAESKDQEATKTEMLERIAQLFNL